MSNTMENIKTMLLEDSHRWQCPNYCGVVVVPKKYLKATVWYLSEFVCGNDGIRLQQKDITFDTGARLLVREHKPEGRFEQDHCGMQYTSILVSSDECTCHNVNYLMSRMRSRSEHPSKFVMM